jgi:glycosyltransferase involved in cell wall biosynthesis
VLFVGHCSVRKGVHDLLSAFRRLRHPATLRIVGPVDRRLLSLAGGLPANAEAVGPRRGEALAREYREADVFVLASLEEGSALVVTEAMAAGLPVVVSDRAGADHVEHRVNGFLFPAGDRTALRESLEALVRDAELRARIGAAAADSVRTRTWAEYGRQLRDEVFAPLMNGRSS